jgi:ATP-dependent 26S proteasome regulatory subunit
VLDLDALLLAHGPRGVLAKLAGEGGASSRSRLYFWRPPGAGKRSAAEGLAKLLKARLLIADFERCTLRETELGQVPGLLCRDARLHDAVLFVRGTDTLQQSDRLPHYYRLMDELKCHEGVVILDGTLPWSSPGRDELRPYTISFPAPDFSLRRTAWRNGLTSAGIDCDDDSITTLSSRFRLTPGQIAEVIQDTLGGDRRCATAETKPTLEELFGAARSRSGDKLGKMTRRVVPNYTWKDIVLPPDQLAQLREICSQAKLRHVVYDNWGFDRRLSLGKRLNILFAGPPGTGKTMAAEVIAKDLGLYLYKIDLSQVVSKYIGETEKNLDRIFTAAENSNAILFFDEADALFGKRSEVKDSHDRYANIEIGYLLQKMEEYEGIAILATNLRQNLDEAFVRRIQNIVEFPFPAVEQRQRIWEVTFPEETPLGEDLDFRLLARAVKLAGGNIKNIAVIAAFYAAADGGVIGMPHITRACFREYQKLGQTWSGVELGPQPALPVEGN